MKTNLLKRVVSVLLCLLCLVSMLTVSMSTFAAATTQTVYVGVIEYIKDHVPTLHYWNSSGIVGDAALTAIGETKQYSVGSSYWGNAAQNFIVYKTEVPAGVTGMKTWDKTSNSKWAAEDITNYADGKILLLFEYGNTYHNITASYSPAETVEPSGEKTTIYFRDDTSNHYISDDDSNIFVYSNCSDRVKMTETIDTVTGNTLWYADVAVEATNLTFYRASHYYDEYNASSTSWGTFNAGKPTSKLYCATSSGAGKWSTSAFKKPEGTINDFTFGLWVDTKGEGKTTDVVRWHRVSSTEYHLYLPSYVDMNNLSVYSSFYSANIKGGFYTTAQTLSNSSVNSLKLSANTSYTLKAKKTSSDTEATITLKVYKTESTASMLMTTKEELFTGVTDNYMDSNSWPAGSGLTVDNYNGVYKDDIETKGSYYFYDEQGELVNSDPVLKKIKGRGNSSFEASMRLYGKYAYNFNLDKKATLIEGSTASKKWCMLANNTDHSMMRNTFIYSLADDIGIKYAPETRLVDVYDNGKYLGAYVITEKVEYGSNTLMKDMKNLDDGNEDANIEYYGDEDIMDELENHLIQTKSSFTTNGKTYTYQYTESDDKTNWPYKQPENFKEYNYLLEFELYNRYKNEASWFVSPRTGQAVVVKYPEFATKDEMQWIISEFEKVESAVYSNDYSKISELIDVDSFVKMYLLQELSVNLDSCATSYYIHNDLKSGKLVSSPVWDYDWAFGSYAGTTKYVYNGSSVSNSANMSDPKQMFVKNKALKTDANDNTKTSNYNFQAKLVHNSTVWNRCKYIWTNEFIPALATYVDNDYIDSTSKSDDGVTEGKILLEWLPKFSSSIKMNEARWDTYDGYNGSALRDNWGTKVTSDYTKRSFNFKVSNTGSSGSSSKSYENTVYYLNDWIVERWNYMSSSSGGALYDASMKEEFLVSDVDFTAELNGTQLTVTPKANATLNGSALDADKYQYTIYLNGKAVTEPTLFTTTSTTITLPENQVSEVYVLVSVVDHEKVSDVSSVQKFECKIGVDVTVNFKSMSLSQYAPTLTVNGNSLEMTKSDSVIYENTVDGYSFCWYTATITVEEGVDTEITFTNKCELDAKVSISATEEKTYYFGVNNLYSGTEVVDLTEAEEYIRNFAKSHFYMLENDPEQSGVAYTAIEGVSYKMGDADVDDVLTILDATLVQHAIAKKKDLSDIALIIADYNLDGVISIMDVTMIQTYLANNG